MRNWRLTKLGNEIELAYGKPLPAHTRAAGTTDVFGSNGIVGAHIAPLVDGPGIIVGRKGSIGEVVFSARSFWPIDTTYFVRKKGDHDWRFLYHLLKWKKLNEINRLSPVTGLNREDVYSLDVELPERSEQYEVGRGLDAVETAIALEENAIGRTQDLKRGAMHKLFTRGLRGAAQKETAIGLVPESWDVREFESVRDRLQYGTSVHCTNERTAHPVLRIPNIEPGRVNATDLKYANLQPKDAERYHLEKGDLIFVRTNGVIERLGAAAVYEGEPEGALFASYLIRAKLKRDEIEPRFASYFFQSDLGTSIVTSRATPASDGKYNLNTGAIDGFHIPLPPTLDEERDVVAILDAIDRKIDLHCRKRAMLDELFKTLLHKLMTGEIRIADLDLSAVFSATEAADVVGRTRRVREPLA